MLTTKEIESLARAAGLKLASEHPDLKGKPDNHLVLRRGDEVIGSYERFCPQESMDHAMEVVYGLLEMGCEQPTVGKISTSEVFQEGTWRCTMQDKRAGPRDRRISVIAPTPQEAICKAALKFLSNPE